MYKSIKESDEKCGDKFKQIIIDEANGKVMFSDKDDGHFEWKVDANTVSKEEGEKEKAEIPDFENLKKILEEFEMLKGMLSDED